VNQAANNSNWIDAWLETQRGWLGRWQSVAVEQRTDAMRVGMEMLREHLNPANISPEAMNVVQSFQGLLQSCMAGAAELAGVTTAEGDGAQDIWRQMLNAFPVGPAREHQVAWQAYLRAQADCHLRMQTLLQAYGQVFTQSLQAVQEQVEARAAQGAPIAGVRELYELWIKCGEQIFAVAARDPEFIAAQAAGGNALSRLKLAQQALMELWLKMHDLPTRSELNSVHLRLRELTARVADLERQLTSPAARKSSADKPVRAVRRRSK
jgi:class III poly(R)-hydroxyalkanoic acid synthase PhaE subunit